MAVNFIYSRDKFIDNPLNLFRCNIEELKKQSLISFKFKGWDIIIDTDSSVNPDHIVRQQGIKCQYLLVHPSSEISTYQDFGINYNHILDVMVLRAKKRIKEGIQHDVNAMNNNIDKGINKIRNKTNRKFRSWRS